MDFCKQEYSSTVPPFSEGTRKEGKSSNKNGETMAKTLVSPIVKLPVGITLTGDFTRSLSPVISNSAEVTGTRGLA
jgi:hypothetical protein